MLSHSSTSVAVVDGEEDFLRTSAIANETPAPDVTRLPIRRNVALLSAAVAANASTRQLTAAVASISRARVLDVEGLLGLGPALVLAAATAEVTQSWERGRLLGFNHVLSGATGAGLTLLGGLALTAAGVAALAWMRRELPWVPIQKAYAFETNEGTETLAELFDGRSQLIVYHFMFGPDWDAGCEGQRLQLRLRGLVHE